MSKLIKCDSCGMVIHPLEAFAVSITPFKIMQGAKLAGDVCPVCAAQITEMISNGQEADNANERIGVRAED